MIAAETFLAEIAQNVAGNRFSVRPLMPYGLDPHEYEPTPQDVAAVADSDVLIVNGSGLEQWLSDMLKNVGGNRRIIEASSGLKSRPIAEPANPSNLTEPSPTATDSVLDPHFWLDPNLAATYVENIRDGFTAADPAGKGAFSSNAAAYIVKLNDLDDWIRQQVSAIPESQRLLVTNHESLGYFADRYGFRIAGTIIPSISSLAEPSAQQIAQLVDQIRSTGAKAIFLETGANPQLADQIALETGVKVVTGLYTHSITAPDGDAPTYIEMIKRDVEMIVDALK